MDTLYVINGQTVYSFCFSTRCKTTRTTSLGVNKRTSTREVPNPLVIIIGVLVLIALSISIVNLIMSIRMNRRIGNISSKLGTIQSDKNDTIGIVFCKKCGSKYSVADRQCPFCGEKRQ